MSDIKLKLQSRRKIKEVEVSEIGTVYLKKISAGDGEIYNEALTSNQSVFCLLVQLCLCDATGNRLFDNLDEVKDLDQDLVETLFMECARHNGLLKDQSEALEKNS